MSSYVFCLLSSALCPVSIQACSACLLVPIHRCVSTFTLVYLYLYDSFVLLVRLFVCLLDLFSWLVIDVPQIKVCCCFVFACLGFWFRIARFWFRLRSPLGALS